MITKNQFIDKINRIMEYRAKIEALDEAIRPFGYVYYGDDACLEYVLVDCLELALNDKNHWISYFLYERNGDLSDPCVFDADKKAIDTSSWGAIYDLICEDAASNDDKTTGEKFGDDKASGIQASIFDEETIYKNCTVQVLRNSITGDVSVGWWPNEEG